MGIPDAVLFSSQSSAQTANNAISQTAAIAQPQQVTVPMPEEVKDRIWLQNHLNPYQ